MSTPAILCKGQDNRPQKGAWAPGMYVCKCWSCAVDFLGDKWAISCADCAYRVSEGEPSVGQAMTPDQAPNACPFCGAAKKQHLKHIGFRWFECGTMTAPANNIRRDQTPTCATAERSRLTRERDEARVLAARRGEVLEKLVSKASASLASAGIQEGELGDRIEWACASVRQLESEWSGWPALQREWFGDKYASMQPLDAVRARIEDDAERIKRLEEAGEFLDDVADAADDDIREHLQVANYNLHGLMNTGKLGTAGPKPRRPSRERL